MELLDHVYNRMLIKGLTTKSTNQPFMTNLKTIPRGALNAIFAYYSSYLNLGIVKMLSNGHCSN